MTAAAAFRVSGRRPARPVDQTSSSGRRPEEGGESRNLVRENSVLET